MKLCNVARFKESTDCFLLYDFCTRTQGKILRPMTQRNYWKKMMMVGTSSLAVLQISNEDASFVGDHFMSSTPR